MLHAFVTRLVLKAFYDFLAPKRLCCHQTSHGCYCLRVQLIGARRIWCIPVWFSSQRTTSPALFGCKEAVIFPQPPSYCAVPITPGLKSGSLLRDQARKGSAEGVRPASTNRSLFPIHLELSEFRVTSISSSSGAASVCNYLLRWCIEEFNSFTHDVRIQSSVTVYPVD